jgi:putative ABC transport system ATP-binding protein
MLVSTYPIPQGQPAQSTSVISAAYNLIKVYGKGESEVRALNGATAEFNQGGFYAIMGPSGSGKSTLMHCLAGLDRPDSGQVILAGMDITTLNDKELTRLRRDRIGFIFQAFNLLPTLTAKQNIVLPLELAGAKVDRAHLDAVVASLHLEKRLDHLPSQLSGGQQQRVAVARALITKPDVIFADEPTGALDSSTSAQLLQYLRDCVTNLGQTIVMVTHDPNAAGYADKVLILSDGQIVMHIDHPNADVVLGAMKQFGA